MMTLGGLLTAHPSISAKETSQKLGFTARLDAASSPVTQTALSVSEYIDKIAFQSSLSLSKHRFERGLLFCIAVAVVVDGKFVQTFLTSALIWNVRRSPPCSEDLLPFSRRWLRLRKVWIGFFGLGCCCCCCGIQERVGPENDDTGELQINVF